MEGEHRWDLITEREREKSMQSKQKHFFIEKKRVNSSAAINGNKQCKKEDNKEMQEVGEKKSTTKQHKKLFYVRL